MAQSGLFGGIEVAAKLPKRKRASNNVISEQCCEACYKAKEEACRCRCQGRYHGLGNPNWNKNQKRLDEGLEE